MADENTTTTTDSAATAASTGAPQATATASAAPQPFIFPESLPQHECDWLTDAEKRQKLDARCCGIRISTDRKGSPVAHIALRLEPGQQCFSVVAGKVVEVGGTVAITQRYLTGGARDNTFNSLRILGFTIDKARAAYAKDPQALSMAQQAKAKGFADDKIEELVAMLALQRGDIAACGLGSKVARIDSKDDLFTTSKGEELVTRKVNWIEAIPAAVSADAVFELADLLGGAMRPAKAQPKPAGGGAQPAKGATSKPPTADKDSVDF